MKNIKNKKVNGIETFFSYNLAVSNYSKYIFNKVNLKNILGKIIINS